MMKNRHFKTYSLLKSIGMTVVFMNAFEHDKIYAQVSHFGLRFNKKYIFFIIYFYTLFIILNAENI